MPIISQATTKQFATVIPMAFSAIDTLEKAKAKVDTVSWVLISDSLLVDGFTVQMFQPKVDPKTGKKVENSARIAVKGLIEGNYPEKAKALMAKDPKTLNEKTKAERRALTQRWTALLAKILSHMEKDEKKADEKSDDEKALIMIQTLIAFLKSEGKTWKKVRRVEAESFCLKAKTAIEGMKQ